MDRLDAGEQAKRIYLVEVQQRGSAIAAYTVEAPDALAAINQVERLYGEPVNLEEIGVEDEDRQDYLFILARHWHGYMFQARAL
jgi:hypothetical protein